MNYDTNRAPIAVILAAGMGSQLSPLTDDCPQSLLSVGGSVILERMIRNCLSCGISQFVIVLGHRSDQIRRFVEKMFRGIRVTYVMNDRFRDTNSGYSLMLAATAIGGSEIVKFNADVVFDARILRRLVDTDLPNLICVDRNTVLEGDAVKVIADDQMRVLEIGTSVDAKLGIGESIGIEKISTKAAALVFAELRQMMENPAHAQDGCETAYARIVAQGSAFSALDVSGLDWTKIDTAADFAAANLMFGSPITTISRGQQRAQDEASKAKPK